MQLAKDRSCLYVTRNRNPRPPNENQKHLISSSRPPARRRGSDPRKRGPSSAPRRATRSPVNVTNHRRLAALAIQLFVVASATAAELKIGLSADVTTLDPHFVAAQPNLTAARHVFESLTDVDEKTRLIPGLAESWRALDAMTWEFKLRRGVKFHDGSDFTVEDVVFSLDRPYAIKGSPGGFTSYVRAITEKKIVDSHTIQVKTSVPYGALPQDINSILIVSKKAATNAGSEDFDSGRAMVGTGPYRFVRFARGERIELVRNDAYWGPKPAWDRVQLRLLPSDPVRSAALLSGELDAI